ncbi:MAG: DUF357 domain-containing protein [Methanoregula sp.]|uniref:DUF357 domain-containing protein n=1 Tax=Methanoregula sp. TaxID=2052170 RepID=UPI003BB0A56D
MLIVECGKLLSGELEALGTALPEGTPLSELAGIVKDMADAYADDGKTFFLGGDRVNALAAFYYGYGWLHFGLAYGLLSLQRKGQVSCPFSTPVELLSPAFSGKLDEKTRRYARLLETACASVVPAPEPETTAETFSQRVILIGRCYARGGMGSLTAGSEEEALARFSYGHGWLDAGVRTGLLALVGNREIFTI